MDMFTLEGTGDLLAPTCEEEVTRLASHTIHSYRQLPLLLFQTGSSALRLPHQEISTGRRRGQGADYYEQESFA